MKDYKVLPKIALWALLGIGIICTIMFFFLGGSEGDIEVAGELLSIPYFTNLFLFWNYILVLLVILVTLGVVVWEFFKLLKSDQKKAIRSLIVVVCFIALVVACWLIGSPEEVKILGYEGTDNIGNMARLSDACMYLTYVLVLATVVTLVWGVVHTKKLSK